MSFKASGPKTRPERVKPVPAPTSPWPTSRRSSASSTTSFHSAQSDSPFQDARHTADRFSTSEEQSMLTSSNDLKSQANTLFAREEFVSAISTYDRAAAELPNYLDYEMAVLQSNIAACHLKLEQWKDAVDAAEKGLDGLEREMPTEKRKKKKNPKSSNDAQNPKSPTEADTQPDDTVVELPSDEEDAVHALSRLALSDTRKADITRIRVKLLLRRARARSSMPPSTSFSDPPPPRDKDKDPANPNTAQTSGSTWSNLSSALADYTLLQSTPSYWSTLPPSDRKTVTAALSSLPAKIDEAKQREVGEMMGKLKDLGNTVLKPFGLSTENFKVVQGEGGGYSLSFDQGKK